MSKEKSKSATESNSKTSAKALDFDVIKDRVDGVKEDLSGRDSEFDRYEKMYLLDPDSELGKSSRNNAKRLYDTHPHDTVNAIARMYTINEATISVPTPKAETKGLSDAEIKKRQDARAKADKVEGFLRALLYRMQDVSQRNIATLALKQYALFDESTIIIDPVVTDDAKAPCPFVFDAPHPKTCYPRYSRRHGLLYHAVIQELEYDDLVATYGEKRMDAARIAETTDPLEVRDYVDRDVHCVYAKDYDDQPILLERHALKFIPRVSMLASGNEFFTDEADRRVPFLFGMLKGGLWAARNLNLTLMLDNLIKYLNSPLIEKTSDGKPLGINFDVPFAEYAMPANPGVGVEQLVKNVIPSEQLQFFNLLSGMAESGTMSRIATTGSIPGQLAAATVASLTANSRVATHLIANATNRALSRALSIVLEWIASRGQKVSVWGVEGLEEITPEDIGEYTRVIYTLKPDMQMEKNLVTGLATNLFGARLAGYDTALEILESGGVIKSAGEAMKDILERAFIEASLPGIAKEAAATAQQMIGRVQSVPRAPAAPAAPGAGVEPVNAAGQPNSADILSALDGQLPGTKAPSG